ncbi:MAG: TRAM domain-containing protein, partial [Pseudomonadota bacterium]
SKRENPRDLIERIRAISRPLSLRTTMMVGFPGETAKVFQELYDFVEWGAFDHLGTFVYSPEKGTPAARLRHPVAREAAVERQNRIMALQREISEKKNQRLVGQMVPVLIEGKSPETDLLLRGRTAGMAPDVDSQVLINQGLGTVGEIVPVRITEAYPYDLVGEIL